MAHDNGVGGGVLSEDARRVLDAVGARSTYQDAHGRGCSVPEASLAALHAALGGISSAELAARAPEFDPVTVAFVASGFANYGAHLKVRCKSKPAARVVCEVLLLPDYPEGDSETSVQTLELAEAAWEPCASGSAVYQWEAALKLRAEPGYYRLRCKHGAETHTVLALVAPEQQATLRRRYRGLFAPLHTLGSQAHAPDLSSLASLARGLRSENLNLVGTLPLYPSFCGYGQEPYDPSPYSPVSRLMFHDLWTPRSELTRTLQRLGLPASAHAPDIGSGDYDYRKTYRDLVDFGQKALATADVDRVHAALSAELSPRHRAYAAFRARLAAPEEGARKGLENWHLLAQVALGAGLKELRSELARVGSGLYLDLPLGVSPSGFDAQAFKAEFLPGFSVGAPPDLFFLGGQDWGFAASHPLQAREEGYRYLISALRFALTTCDVLRVDHIMGLERLFLVPHGTTAKEGFYLEYPADELYALMLLEAARGHVHLIGENLGTVPPSTAERLTRHRVGGMFIFSCETYPGRSVSESVAPPRTGLASLNTHDLVPFHGWLEGDDLDLAHKLGFIDTDALGHRRSERAQLRSELASVLGVEGSNPKAILTALLGRLEAQNPDVLLIDLFDLIGERRMHNVPGTPASAGNWQARPPLPADEMLKDAAVRNLLRIIGMGQEVRERAEPAEPSA